MDYVNKFFKSFKKLFSSTLSEKNIIMMITIVIFIIII